MTTDDHTELVLRHDEGAVATLTLNRPDKLNALSVGSFVRLREHLDALASDESIHCVVLTGAGRSFCAGNDLAGIAAGERASTPTFNPETIDALEQLPQPTIARIQGHCFTGGLELALGCDLLIAADDAQLADTHGTWGLVPIWGMSVRLPERVGRSRAKMLSFTARRISGTEAAEIGLVDQSVPADDLEATVDALAAQIVANSPGTNRRMKKLIDDRWARTREDALLHERSSPYGTPEDREERMRAGGR